MIRQDWSTLKKLMFMKTAAGGGAAVEATATGNPLTFQTDLAKPLKSLLIPFTPIQSGTGDPSPQNIRSILPLDGLKVWNGGRNLCPLGTVTFSRTKKSYIGELPAGTYTISALVTSTDTDNTRCLFRLWKDDSPVGSDIYFTRNARDKYTITINEPFNYAYMYASDSYVHTDGDTATFADIQIETGSTPSAYEPYKPITETDISFTSPVYGGSLDVVSGVLTVEYAEVILNGTEEWFESENKFFVTSVSALKNNTAKQNIFCDLFKYSLNGADYLLQGQFTDSISSSYNIWIRKHDDAMTLQEFRSLLASNNMHIVYKTETPTEQTLTGHQITALVGDNTIWSDADGQMTATYLKKG